MGKEDPPIPVRIIISDNPPPEFAAKEFQPGTAHEVAQEIADEFHTDVVVTVYDHTEIEEVITHIPND